MNTATKPAPLFRRPVMLPAADYTPRVIIARHPQGGWTHAIASGPVTRVYSGWWPTARAASDAIR